ncbi:MarC family NAAT transporter [Providencia rettgeri]|uniref:MarC family NAAT transporter n=1 Tax=Providencia TaxID=586 RepID=UPI001CFCBA7E|nr:MULTISPECIES: MarC family NAAT transporter [Providencia]EIU7556576.1 MarC family NAAT transporter [Providencia rettgeri]EIU7559628.1 MarC family NAAT transporter [Providencia rettgeri]MCB4841661.1 MarC family NAAT transporter [Providencia rettgeri]MCG5277524.1 MarC family NAAT transporter [Providencia rettgeri]MCG9509805.1 MarC family NAAT transporter [Providencia rettgeri]
MFELLTAIGIGLVVLLPLSNPLTTVALFLGLSGGMTIEARKKTIKMTPVYVFFIMLASWYSGQAIMNTFGVTIPGLRIAGGFIVAYIGFRMLFPIAENSSNVEGGKAVDNTSSIAFVPLAMPSTAGPGTIAMIISMASSVITNESAYPHWVVIVAPPLVFLIFSVILWASLKSSNLIMKFFGKSGIDAISRLMGFLLVCMGVQFIITGIGELTRSGFFS